MSVDSSLTYEQALAQLDSTLRALEEGKLSLEDAIAAVARGREYLELCERKLDEARQRFAGFLFERHNPVFELLALSRGVRHPGFEVYGLLPNLLQPRLKAFALQIALGQLLAQLGKGSLHLFVADGCSLMVALCLLEMLRRLGAAGLNGG